MTWKRFMKALFKATGAAKQSDAVKAIEFQTRLSRASIYDFMNGKKDPKAETVIIALLQAGRSLGVDSSLIEWGVSQFPEQVRDIIKDRVYGND